MAYISVVKLVHIIDVHSENIIFSITDLRILLQSLNCIFCDLLSSWHIIQTAFQLICLAVLYYSEAMLQDSQHIVVVCFFTHLYLYTKQSLTWIFFAKICLWTIHQFYRKTGSISNYPLPFRMMHLFLFLLSIVWCEFISITANWS